MRRSENEPGLGSNMEEGDDLESARDKDLTDERREHLLRYEVGGRSFRVNTRESFRSSHYEFTSVESSAAGRGRTGDGDRENKE